MPLMQRDKFGEFVDVSKVPVPKPRSAKVEPTNVVEVAQVPTIDCENVPDGRYGIDKIRAWFDDNGLTYDEHVGKDELLEDAKALCAEQEQS